MFPNLINKVIATARKYSMLQNNDKILVGLSGGPDSSCLLHVLNDLKEMFKLDIHALYIDHGLRPEEIPSEITFCEKMCKLINIPFMKSQIDVITYAKDEGINRHEAARQLRYRVYEETANNIKATKIALGHNADDQAETVLIRLIRGTGPTGLAGIPPVRGSIIRPLIEIERKEIEQFLDERKIDFIIDSSNLKKDYLRNKIRLSVLPILKNMNPDICRALSKTATIFREEEKYFEIIVTKTMMKLFSRKTQDHVELFLTPFEIMDKPIMRRVLRRVIDETKGLRGVNFIHIEDIIELIRNGKPGDRIYLPKGLRVIKDYAILILTSKQPHKLGTLSLQVPGEVVSRENKFVIKANIMDNAANHVDGKTSIILDLDKTGTNLTVRSRQKGDYFYPMGFGKRKKLQDYFVDEKVPRDERNAIPIVISGDSIVWIAGFRGDERFRVSQTTKRFLKLEIKKVL
ncbi:MAG: tRNA lysidine(34) synthetase TilS [Nitrospirae bacterium]|nr:tRNA lysidine(34) synthetase TilS [Nitrospirota bacterium]